MKRDVLGNVIARMMAVGLLFAAAVLVARALGPDGQGRYFVAMTFSMLLLQFANLGLQSSNVFFLSQDMGMLTPLLANSVWLSLVLGSGVGTLAVAGLQMSGVDLGIDWRYLWLGAAMTTPRMFFMLGGYLLLGLNRLRELNLLHIGSGLLTFVCLLSGIVAGAGPAGLLWLTLLAWVATAAALMICLLRRSTERPEAPFRVKSFIPQLPKSLAAYRFRYQIFHDGLRYSIKAYLCCLLGFVVLRMNVFFLQASHGDAEVGVYSVASQAADLLTIVPTSFALILLPRLVRNPADAWSMLRRSLAEMAGFMLIACIAAACLIKPAVQLAFGAPFMSAVPMLLWMLPAVFFLGLTSVVSQYLNAVGIPRRSIELWFGAMLLQCALGAWLVPRYGGIGAAATLSVVHTTNFVLQGALACHVAKKRVMAPRDILPDASSQPPFPRAAA